MSKSFPEAFYQLSQQFAGYRNSTLSMHRQFSKIVIKYSREISWKYKKNYSIDDTDKY